MSGHPTRRRQAGSAGEWMVLLICLAVLFLLVGGVYYRASSSQNRSRREAANQAARERTRRDAEARAERKISEARGLLLRAMDQRLFPATEHWRQASALYAEARAIDDGSEAAAVGLALSELKQRSAQTEPEQVETELRAVSSGEEEQLARYLLGWQLLSRDRALDAWGVFQVLLKARPGWFPAEVGLAWADMETGDYRRACPALEQAVERWPDRPGLTAGLARCLDLSSRSSSSLVWHSRAYALGVHAPDVVEAWVSAMLREQRLKEAQKELTRLIDREPFRSDLHYQLARVLEAEEQAAEAAAEYLVALDQDPDNPHMHLALGALYARHRQPAAALPLFEQAIRLAPELADPFVHQAHALLGLGRKEEALGGFLSACHRGSVHGCREACRMGEQAGCRAVPPDDAAGVVNRDRDLEQEPARSAKRIYVVEDGQLTAGIPAPWTFGDHPNPPQDD